MSKSSDAAPIVAKNTLTGTIGTNIMLQTNTYGIGLIAPTNVYVYDVFISFQSKTGKTVVFTKKGKDDHVINTRRDRCFKAYTHLLENHTAFFGNSYACWYDGQSLLFAKKDFFEGRDETHALFPVSGYLIDEELAGIDVSFEIKQSAEKKSFLVDADSVVQRTANADLSTNDRLITQFMELAINQYAIMHPERHKVFENGKSFMCNPLNEGFKETDIPQVGDGKRLFVGTKKAIRHLEGPKGRAFNNPVLIIDALKAAFHEEMTVAQKAFQIIKARDFNRPVGDSDIQKLRSTLRGLACKLNYGSGKVIEIFDISSVTAQSSRFETQQGIFSVQSYYEKVRGIRLQYINAPLIVAKERGKQTLIPMEVATIVPFQRVTIPQQTSEQSQRTTKECAVLPLTRIRNIELGAKALEILNPENEYIKNAGLKIFSKRLMCQKARLLPSPSLKYGPVGGTGNPHTGTGKWRPAKAYLIPASVEIWAIYRIGASQLDGQTRGFAEWFWKTMNEKDMHVSQPTDLRAIDEAHVEATLRDAAAHGCKYVLMITPDAITTLHKKLKLLERELNMVVQDLKASTVSKVMLKRQSQTMENIVNKTNIKLGGLNYSLDINPLLEAGRPKTFMGQERLILGIGMCHPAPGVYGETLPPSVVGYSANVKENTSEFVGDFLLQAGRLVPIIPVLPNIIRNIIQLYKNNHKGKAPAEIVIYRAGLDEGSYTDIIVNEVPFIKQQLFEQQCIAKVVYIVAQKEQPLRFFRTEINPSHKPHEQNIPPGVVIDEQIIHPSFKEFYLNSHITIQGSASTPRYNVLVDEIGLTMNEVEGLTYALAHNHQIISQTISLPSPLYCANLYAARGRDLFQEFWAVQSEEQKTAAHLSGDWKEVSQMLNYESTNFSTVRVNA